MKKLNYSLLFIVPMLLLGACKKGDMGQKGEAGPTGPAGADGTSNIIYSDWAVAKNFRDTVADNSKMHIGDLAAPKLTSAMLDNATVMIYLNFGGGVYILPYTSYAGGKLNTLSFLPRAGHFIITRFTADNTNSIPLSTALQYRYVIIPGGISAAAVANHVDIKNYESVRKYYGITN